MKKISEETEAYIDENKLLDKCSLEELCRELSISTATGRNWIRLGKLTPDHVEGSSAYFSREQVDALKDSIKTGTNKSLKNRRNKKYVSGNNLYDSYISKDSANVRVVENVLATIACEGVKITDEVLQYIIAECAIQLFVQRIMDEESDKYLKKQLLQDYVEGEITFGVYDSLIDDLISDSNEARVFAINYHKIFDVMYMYEDGEDILGLLYLSCKNIAHRKATGSYYTPTAVVRQLVERLECGNDNLHNVHNKTIIDPCCGTGNFLLQLPDDFFVENIYGNDIDAISVKIARINMALKYRVQDVNILYSNITDSNFLIDECSRTYDYIVGNPPWGYDFSEEECGWLREKYSTAVGKNIESYDLFVERALQKVKTGGVVSFVLPEAILNVRSHMPVREVMMGICSVSHLIYLGEVFHKVNCPSIILQLRKTDRVMSTVGMVVKDGKRCFTVTTEREVKKEHFDFRMTDEEYATIERIKNVKDAVYLKGNATFALGIVTGNNEEYITHTRNARNEIILKGTDIEKYSISNCDNYIEFEPERFQQVAPTEYYRASEKLVYRFIGNKLVFAYDDKQTLTLNSCNILIPHIEGLDMKYILAVLNSSIVQFFYEKEFGSVKVLRSYLEQIPIPRVDKDKQQEIISLVETLINENTDSTEYRLSIYKIDELVRRLYIKDMYTSIGAFDIAMPPKGFQCQENIGIICNNIDKLIIKSCLTRVIINNQDDTEEIIEPIVMASCMNPDIVNIIPITYTEDKALITVETPYKKVIIEDEQIHDVRIESFIPKLKKNSCIPCRNCGRC